MWADHVPFLNGDRLAEGVQRVAERLKDLAGNRDLLYRAVVWAAANWLLDAGCLWVFIAAFHHYVSPINVLVAYGLANILAVIPITPGGLGIIEGVLIPALHGFGVPLDIAGPAVLGYRVVNFWLPIPVGGVAYLSLRFETLGWRQRLHNAARRSSCTRRRTVGSRRGAPCPRVPRSRPTPTVLPIQRPPMTSRGRRPHRPSGYPTRPRPLISPRSINGEAPAPAERRVLRRADAECL